MAQQDGGIGAGAGYVRSAAAIVWIVVSTVVYGIACMIVCVFSRALGHRIGKAWCSHMLRVIGVRLRVDGLEELDAAKRWVVVSNHQSHLDIPVLFAALPYRLVFMAKKELFYIPFFGWGIAALGHIRVDRGSARKARASFTRAAARLRKEEISVVIFPEGTRSPDGTIGEFKRGSFTLAIESGLAVLPVNIEGTRAVLPKKSFLFRPGEVNVRLGAPIEVGEDKESLAADVRGEIERLARPGTATGQ